MRASPIDRPYPVREVITLASPYNLPTASTIEPLIRLVGSFYEPAINIDRLASPLPMRSTAIFSRDDGLVAWESCRREDEGCSIVEFSGPHLTVCQNPDVLRAVAASLGA